MNNFHSVRQAALDSKRRYTVIENSRMDPEEEDADRQLEAVLERRKICL